MTGSSPFIIRDETFADHERIREVTFDAFGNSSFGYHGEADLIDNLRDSAECLSLVACVGEQLVGHLLMSPARIETTVSSFNGMGLAPMSVASAWQRRGLGTALIKAGLRRLANACDFVVVLGHPDYYSRFGFVPAANFGVTHGFADIPQEPFLIQAGSSLDLNELTGGRAFYRPEFGPQYHGK